ncbi:MAG: site-specific DNA-methyltransferase [Alphaproteobacteria bacterium]|nr:site-specific DNA-methyltransferase [Alphaproteobacteria bacterium]
MTEPEKMDLRSMDVAAEKRDELKHCLGQVFPEVFAEGKIDFDQLKRVLGEWVEPGKERFGLNWPGKAECMKIIQQPSVATLKPVREESVNFDETENLFIEGDNLEVLKLLQKAYFGKIKMIYIDPPYNTGGDFIYPDNFSETLETYLRYTSQIDEYGNPMSSNVDTSGRYHSRWLSMMYPRLYLAHSLLSEFGCVFISIDDTEAYSLKHMMDDIFGEENFVANIAWQKVFAKKNKALISGSHDHVLVYVKNIEFWVRNLLPRTDEQLAAFKNMDNDPRGKWQSVSFSVQSEDAEKRAPYRYKITLPSGREVLPPVGRHWNGLPDKFNELTSDNRIWFGTDGDSPPRVKVFLSEVQEGIVPDTWWSHDETGNNQEAKKEIIELFGEGEPFSTPKPTRLISRMLKIATSNDGGDLVLDFFSGSCTTAHSVLKENLQDNGNRKFIMVQLPEPTLRPDFKTIADIGMARIRKAAKQIESDCSVELNLREIYNLDLGFKAFKLDRSNFKVWDGNAETFDESGKQLELHVDHLSPASSAEDILYELLLKAGFPLTTKVTTVEMAGKQVFSVQDGNLLICLEKELTSELIDALAEANPSQVICLDEGFKGNDQLKTNAVQTFKSRAQSKETEIVFRTV